MKIPCTVKRLIDGGWQAEGGAPEIGRARSTGATRDEALSKLLEELRFLSEWCPCSGVSMDVPEMEVTDLTERAWRGTVF